MKHKGLSWRLDPKGVRHAVNRRHFHAGGAKPSACALTMVAVSFLIAGCTDSGDLRRVSGVVTLDGTPTPTGNIVFQPVAGGRPSTGKIQSDGSYSLSTFEESDGVAPGSYRVSIDARRAVGEVVEGQRRPVEMEWVVPQRYANFGTSGLSAEVADSGRSTINFELSTQ